MLWLALCFHRLPLDLIERADPTSANTALAITDHLHLRFVNAQARAAGLYPGMKRATAQALAPQTLFRDDDPLLYQQGLDALAYWAQCFTPSVVIWPPQPARRTARKGRTQAPAEPHEIGLLLEIGASLRLFRGLKPLLSHISQELGAQAYRCQAGIAPNALAAWLFALEASACNDTPDAIAELIPLGCTQNDDTLTKRLAALPLHRLEQARPWLKTLHTMGAQTFGELLDLPRAGLAQRFGKSLLEAIDQAMGKRGQALAYFQAPEQFDHRFDLPIGFETTPLLLTAAGPLLETLTTWLRVRQAALRRFDLSLIHHEPPDTVLTIHTRVPSRDYQRLHELLTSRLEIVQLRAPVHGLRLRCTDTQAMVSQADDLFARPEDDQEGLGRLLERLQIRLGNEQIQRLALTADHRPEAAYEVQVIDRLEQIGATNNAQDVDLRAGGARLPRPLWLLREPKPLSERNNRPWLRTALQIVAGPERIETGWWDDHLIQRDYFVAEDDDHHLYWIYRERGQSADDGWFVQGCFG